MTLRTAKEHFEAALVTAEQERDEFRKSIAAGLLDLAAAMQQRTTRMQTEIEAIKRKVS